MPTLFVMLERKITCRSILHAFILFSIVIDEFIDSISYMIHISL